MFFSALLLALLISVWARAEQATLAWDANTESDLAGYKLHYGTASNSYSVHIDVNNVTTYTVAGLTAGQTYYFAATAYDASGNESGYSNSVSYAVPAPNGVPSTPATPSGASSALVNTTIAFSTSATDPNGDSLEYRYDWGGGAFSGWGTASQSHSWTAVGQYAVKAQAKDSRGAESAWSAAKTVTITQSTQNAAPTTPATPSGASSALVNAAITFSTSASDPNGDSLQYRFDWGGGVLSGWGAASQSRSWAAAGQYAVKAQARDSIGAESAWSSARTVTIFSPAPVVVDTDGDGVPDNQDAFPNDPAEWADANGNGIGDNTDAAQNHPPAAPQVLAPKANAVTALTPTLQVNAFVDPDAGDSHARTRWQIVQASNSLLVLDVTSTEELTAFAVPSLLLDENTEYYWRAVFYDNRGAASEWSPQAWFQTDFNLTDANGNGIPDSQEVDSGTDLNGNGVNDNEDVNVKAVHTKNGAVKVGIGTAPSSGVFISSIESTDPDVLDIDADADGISDTLPFGLLNFKLILDNPGDQAVFTVYFSEPVPKKGRWYKYDPGQGRWSDFSRHAQFSADRMSMTLTITDGGEGDADGVANGVILDPAGVLEASSSGGDSLIDGVVGGVGSVVDSAQSGCFIGAAASGGDAGDGVRGWWLASGMLSMVSLLLRKVLKTGC